MNWVFGIETKARSGQSDTNPSKGVDEPQNLLGSHAPPAVHRAPRGTKPVYGVQEAEFRDRGVWMTVLQIFLLLVPTQLVSIPEFWEMTLFPLNEFPLHQLARWFLLLGRKNLDEDSQDTYSYM